MRRPRGLGWLFVLVLMTAVTAAGGVPFLIAGKDAKKPSYTLAPQSLALPAGASLDSLQRASVEQVIDGDTIRVRTDAGAQLLLRYYGVDTPERGQPCYREATQRNTELVGTKVLLLPDARDQDSFGRTLRYVLQPDGTSVDATLVAEGFGHAWRQDGQYRDQIVALEQQAQATGRGCLWAAK